MSRNLRYWSKFSLQNLMVAGLFILITLVLTLGWSEDGGMEGLAILPGMALMGMLFSFLAFGCGVVVLYLPLLVADPIILKRYERPQGERIHTAFRKGIITTAGYVLAMYATAVLREFLGTGAVLGHTLLKTPLFPMAQLPSGGFIVLALMIAVWRGGVNIVKRQMGLGAKQQA